MRKLLSPLGTVAIVVGFAIALYGLNARPTFGGIVSRVIFGAGFMVFYAGLISLFLGWLHRRGRL
jgi:hypothetical protein